MAYYNLVEWDEYDTLLKADFYIWIWCLASISANYGEESVISETKFISDSSFLIPSIITTIIIILVVVNLFILTKSVKTRKLDTKNFVKSSLISALLLIITMIIYMSVIDFIVYNGVDLFGEGFLSTGIHFWKYFDIGFGVIAPFLSASLIIIGAGIFKYQSKQEVKTVPIKVPIEKGIESVKTTIDNNLKFCHNCGNKIKKESAYCEFCGIQQ